MKIGLIIALVLGVLLFVNKARGQNGNYKNINVDEFANLMKDKNTVILDVRTPGEIKGGKIKGAKEINIMSPSFSTKIKALDPSKTYLVYCRSGNRSGKACARMEKEGFENLYNLSGGYGAWSAKATR